MTTRRKRCAVWVHPVGDSGEKRCTNKIKPGTPFCKEHFETHKLIVVECTGEAHSNPYIDHCMVCLPHWGRYPAAVPKDYTGPRPDWEGSWT